MAPCQPPGGAATKEEGRRPAPPPGDTSATRANQGTVGGEAQVDLGVYRRWHGTESAHPSCQGHDGRHGPRCWPGMPVISMGASMGPSPVCKLKAAVKGLGRGRAGQWGMGHGAVGHGQGMGRRAGHGGIRGEPILPGNLARRMCTLCQCNLCQCTLSLSVQSLSLG